MSDCQGMFSQHTMDIGTPLRGQRQHAGAYLGLLPLKTHALEHVTVVRLGLELA